ncbi:MAG: class I SAM-dependent methyltransferase [Corynebacterium sp.]|nr:class I SAM-dependent methyltransferase [Corynebacterium sp.]
MDNVSQTLFYPLFGRAQASTRWPDVFLDPWAHQYTEIAKKEGTTAQPMNGFPELVYGLRHIILVQETQKYLTEHPGAAVVNIGCGLDVLAQDLADYDCTIYNLDFSDVIELRHRWVPKADNEIDLPYSATNHEWLTQVDGSNGVIALAGGVFFYLEIEDVAALIDAFGKAFPGSRMVYDAESPEMTARSERMLVKQGTPATMPFKVKDPYSPKKWSDTVKSVHVEFNFLDYLDPKLRSKLPVSFRLIFLMVKLRRGMYFVRVDY